MVDQFPFLFKSLTQVDNNTFLFQQHLKVARDLLSPSTCVGLFFKTIHWATNGLTLGFHFEIFTPSYLLQHAFQHDI
jgi:hypothetical protein